MRELSKSIPRRTHDPYFMNKYFIGIGLDIGGFPDPLSLYVDQFPKLVSVETWDWEQGDAQFMDGIQDEQLDFVHSSHCLEHLEDPFEGISNWFRILKRGGHLVITVPEEDLYEQGLFPSTFNADHKWTFTINKGKSWSNKSINVLDLIGSLGHRGEIVKLAKLDLHNTYGLVRFDQTRSPITESCVEFVIRKRDLMELAEGGRLPGRRLPKDSTIPYLNQYKLDQQSLIDANKRITPFKDPIFYEE